MRLLFLCSLVFASCSSYLTTADTTRTYNNDAAVVYEAILQYCRNSGIIVNRADKENGIIITSYSPAHEYRYEFNVGTKSDKSNVVLTLFRRSYNGSDSPTVYSDFSDKYRDVFNSIDAILK